MPCWRDIDYLYFNYTDKIPKEHQTNIINIKCSDAVLMEPKSGWMTYWGDLKILY